VLNAIDIAYKRFECNLYISLFIYRCGRHILDSTFFRVSNNDSMNY